MLRDVVRVDGVPKYEVRLARAGGENAICDLCREGFAVSSDGLLASATIERRAEQYYNPTRVRHEIAAAGADRGWQGYVVAVSEAGDVLGAAGGGITDDTVGNLDVLDLNLALRGRGVGTALLDVITEQQKAEGRPNSGSP